MTYDLLCIQQLSLWTYGLLEFCETPMGCGPLQLPSKCTTFHHIATAMLLATLLNDVE